MSVDNFSSFNINRWHVCKDIDPKFFLLDGVDDTSSPVIEKNPGNQNNADAAPSAENCLLVDISDALSEKDRVKFTVHTKTSLSGYNKPEFFVVRQHEEFIWLHDRFEENEEYAGYIIPPAPPRPDFDASREKLQRLGEGEGNMTKEEFAKMKQELEAEYLATFKKTVAMHEVFLTRLAGHPVFRNDSHLKVFLEYDQDLCARPKRKMEYLGGLVRCLGKTTDELYLGATVRDVNDFFETEYNFLGEYHSNLKEAAQRTSKMTNKHKEMADCYIKISCALKEFSITEHGTGSSMEKFLAKTADIFEKARKIECRVASDQDLKLGDTLRYYQRESNAAKALLIRRLRCLAEYETANRNLEKARSKNKDVHAAETAQTKACEMFESMSARGKDELIGFRARRVAAFKKSLVELAELEIKQARSQHDLLRKSLLSLKECE
ncbi:sorting nexin-6-like isoform X1 [Ctenocephalides felis]|uniref:sorting nexin-6-like isoform X1 n=1 Tax=Ctenocephalides felis TaxID=7515 RepID=UPI000E6E2214|nr:sorting nexin-6-like isoform X1 [Ctenocephalides felis]XP_026465749.1 sorting nexin-6-like isoform X1 [Ctenocephalides felis]XP_026465757.1 sorting nexin-6-like isoform X1 [Ctenocephalides felis]XP_026465760.1 sorting nexin-6-like isoform X1 [Ctenocephalides felis]